MVHSYALAVRKTSWNQGFLERTRRFGLAGSHLAKRKVRILIAVRSVLSAAEFTSIKTFRNARTATVTRYSITQPAISAIFAQAGFESRSEQAW